MNPIVDPQNRAFVPVPAEAEPVAEQLPEPAPAQSIFDQIKKIAEQVADVVIEFTTTVKGVKTLQEGLTGLRDAHAIAVENRLFDLDSTNAAFARGWSILKDFNDSCNFVFAPLGLGSALDTVYDSREKKYRILLPKSPAFKDRLDFTQTVGGIALNVIGGIVWLSNKRLISGRHTRLKQSVIPITIGLALVRIASESTDIRQNAALNWRNIAGKVVNIAIDSLTFIFGAGPKIAPKIVALFPQTVHSGKRAFENLYKCGKAFVRA